MLRLPHSSTTKTQTNPEIGAMCPSCHPLYSRRHSDSYSQNQGTLACNAAAKSQQRAPVLELHAIVLFKIYEMVLKVKGQGQIQPTFDHSYSLQVTSISVVFFHFLRGHTQIRRHTDTPKTVPAWPASRIAQLVRR